MSPTNHAIFSSYSSVYNQLYQDFLFCVEHNKQNLKTFVLHCIALNISLMIRYFHVWYWFSTILLSPAASCKQSSGVRIMWSSGLVLAKNYNWLFVFMPLFFFIYTCFVLSRICSGTLWFWQHQALRWKKG